MYKLDWTAISTCVCLAIVGLGMAKRGRGDTIYTLKGVANPINIFLKGRALARNSDLG